MQYKRFYCFQDNIITVFIIMGGNKEKRKRILLTDSWLNPPEFLMVVKAIPDIHTSTSIIPFLRL